MSTAVRRLRGNSVLALDDPAAIWHLERGRLALFAVPVARGAQAGPRRLLFTVEEGETLFGLPGGEAMDVSVIAVALEDSEVVRAAGAAADSEGRAVRRWAERWAAALGGDPGHDAASRDLRALNRRILERVRHLDAENRRKERERLTLQQQESRRATAEAVATLRSVVAAEGDPLPVGPDLFVAASAVARFDGISLELPPPEAAASTDRSRVEAMADASRVRVRKVLLHDGWWREDCGPLLAFRQDTRRPVALLPVRPGRYRLFDPAGDGHGPVDATVARDLGAQAYVFFRALPDRASRASELLRFALRGRARDLAVVLGTGALATLLGMFTPQALALLVDDAVPDGDRRLLLHLALGLAAAAFGAALFRFSQGVALMRVETAADVATQSAVWDRLLKLQPSFFRAFASGDLQSRVSAISQIRAHLGGTTIRTLFSSIVALLNLGLLLYYSARLTIIAIVVALVSAAVTIVSGSMILRRTRALLELRGRFFGLMVQLIHGMAKLRVAAAEERAFARWARDFARVLELELSRRRIEDLVRVLNIAVATLSTIALFAAAASLLGGTALTTGTFLAFNVAYGTFIGSVVSLSNTVTSVMAIAILRERARPILEALPEVDERKADPGRLEGRIEMAQVVFRYGPDKPLVLDDMDLQVAAGGFVALVGPSGGGKSTIFRLLLGFETPTSGVVRYDGQDLSGLDVHAVRRQMGVVLQHGRISAGSLFDNIVTGSNLSLDEAWEAAHAAGFGDEIAAMPMGMHTVVSEGGTNLSGGQRQRLLITRALVHRPSILMLDEATSALDNTTQAIVRDSLARLKVTRLVIAHRLSTIREADRIHVIQGGRIVEAGTFEELSAQDGLFARLMARQMT